MTFFTMPSVKVQKYLDKPVTTGMREESTILEIRQTNTIEAKGNTKRETEKEKACEPFANSVKQKSTFQPDGR